jgi:hypothetical protein
VIVMHADVEHPKRILLEFCADQGSKIDGHSRLASSRLSSTITCGSPHSWQPITTEPDRTP